MYDNATRYRAFSSQRIVYPDLILRFRATLRFAYVLCFLAFGSLAHAQFSRQATVNQTGTQAFSLGTRGVFVTATNTSTVQLGLFATQFATFSGAVVNVAAGATVTLTLFEFTPTQLTSDMTGTIGTQLFTWNGLAANTPNVMGNAPGASKSVSFRWGTSGPVFSHSITIPPATLGVGFVTNSTGTYRNFNHPPETISLSSNVIGVATGVGPPDEMMMFLNNRTGKEQTIRWGDKPLVLAAGMNQFRYDGPKDQNGLPLVRPSDFQGVAVSGSSGGGGIAGGYQGTAVFANLDPTVEGTGVRWGLPPLIPPANPTVTPLQDVVEIISHPTATQPGLTAIRHATGLTTLVGTPAIPSKTPSTVTGGGAVISDPTLPKPVQTTANTTTNIINNTTNNTSTTTSTVVNNSGQPTTVPAIAYQLDPMNQSVEAPDGGTHVATVTSYDAAKTRLTTAQAVTGTGIAVKVDNFKNILAVTSIPKLMQYTQSLTIPGFGTYNLNIDFTKQPFPAVRLASLLVMTLLFGMAMLKRLTI